MNIYLLSFSINQQSVLLYELIIKTSQVLSIETYIVNVCDNPGGKLHGKFIFISGNIPDSMIFEIQVDSWKCLEVHTRALSDYRQV